MVEATAAKTSLPEAPISITVMAYWEGFQVLITKRMGEQSIISQIPGIVALIKGLEEAGFEPVRETSAQALPSPESKEFGKEKAIPICGVHRVPMVWREGDNKNTGRHYAFWACPERNPDGSFCKYRPDKGK